MTFPDSPDPLDRISVERYVNADDRQIFRDRLGDQESVEGVFVAWRVWHRGHEGCVSRLDG
jgi:hypothetical protein